jgi:triosephosphate isomerase (TIM)
MIVINFKNYVFGKNALALAKLIEKHLPDAIVAVPTSDIRMIASKTELKVYAQHVDYFEKKNTTGFIIPEDIKEAGAVGTLLNHSEHQITKETISKTIDRCDEVRLDVLLCIDSVRRARDYLSFEPKMMALEDRELIGSGKSITEFRSNEVKKFVKLIDKRDIIPLCGAGVSKVEDVKAALDIGCDGVLIASAIAKVRLKKADELLKNIASLNYE